jgi:uncharacterized delta-60 repeat protein
MRHLVMVLPLVLLFTSWISPLLLSESAAQTVKWAKRYNGPANGGDYPTALALDTQGNVYVTGRSAGDGINDDYATIKYTPDGTRLWARRYNGPQNGDDEACALAVDAQENAYVTGRSVGVDSNYDYVTFKYGLKGEVLWARRYNGPGNGIDRATDLAVDAEGNVCVTGCSTGIGSTYDYATIKYNPAGERLWVRRYNGPGNGDDQAHALAVDAKGCVYVTGYSTGDDSGVDYATIKYSPTGDRLWVRRYKGPGSCYEAASALAVDAEGNVCVTGCSEGIRGDYLTIKYSPGGEEIWAKRYNGPGNDWDQANALAVDAKGCVYVTGYSAGDGSGDDYVTIKYSPDGEEIWAKRYNGPGNGDDEASALAVDAQGSIYVTGFSRGVVSYDYTTIKYSPAGVRLWAKRYNGPANAYDSATALAVDAKGNVYVTGCSEGTISGGDYFTIKYSQE